MCYKIDPENFFKYRLKEFFVKKFGDKVANAKKTFREQNGNLSEDTLTRDFNARYGSTHIVPAERMAAYSLFLEVDVMQLRTRVTLQPAA